MLLSTSRLDLLRATPAHLRALIESGERFTREFGYTVSPGWLEFPEALLFSLERGEGGSEWWLPYLLLHRGDHALVGMAGYKGPPDGDGMVELGYGVAREYRCQGFATEAARALIANAQATPEVKIIRAHTLPEPNASTRVLERCGFRCIGPVEDPDEGTVWRWEIQ